jgi:ArsR family transcriptional regulator, virulence genes transcriptional regulator
MKLDAKDIEEFSGNVEQAAALMKVLGNPSRLLLLCLLSDGEKNVSELEEMLNLRQPSLSQQLSRLREDDLVETRRDGKSIYYRLASDDAQQVIGLLHSLFCGRDTDEGTAEPALKVVAAE